MEPSVKKSGFFDDRVEFKKANDLSLPHYTINVKASEIENRFACLVGGGGHMPWTGPNAGGRGPQDGAQYVR